MAIKIDFKDNTQKILQEFSTRGGVALNLIGARATAHMQDETPKRTGNLANHGDWEVDPGEKTVEFGFRHDGDPEKNPDYAIYVENGSPTNAAHHMIQKAATNYSAEYKDITEQAYRKP